MSSNFRCLFVFFGVFFTFFCFSDRNVLLCDDDRATKAFPCFRTAPYFFSGGFSFCLFVTKKRRPRKTNAVCLSFGFNYASFFFVKRMMAIAATATNAMMPMVQPTAAPQPAFSVLSATEISYVAVAPL